MGQNYKLINKDKKEQVTAWKLIGFGKFYEWLYNEQARLIIWLLRKSDASSAGDIDLDHQYRTLGRWAGDSIMLIGDSDSSQLWYKTDDWKDISQELIKENNAQAAQWGMQGLEEDIGLK